MSNFVAGFLAIGTNTTGNSFTECADASYARIPVVFSGLLNSTSANLAGGSFGPFTGSVTPCQYAIYDGSTGGNMLAWWNRRSQSVTPAGGTFTFGTGQIKLILVDASVTPLSPSIISYGAGAIFATTGDGPPVYAGTAIAISQGALAAGSSGGGGSLTGAALAALMATLPTTLPGTSGVAWNNGGVLCIS